MNDDSEGLGGGEEDMQDNPRETRLTREEVVKLINEAETLAERERLKWLYHPILYGSFAHSREGDEQHGQKRD